MTKPLLPLHGFSSTNNTTIVIPITRISISYQFTIKHTDKNGQKRRRPKKLTMPRSTATPRERTIVVTRTEGADDDDEQQRRQRSMLEAAKVEGKRNSGRVRDKVVLVG